MKRLTLAWFLLSLVLACTPYRPTEEIKQVEVTKKSLSGHAADRPYVIDLTRTGTLYEVAAGVDPSLVEVRASTRAVPLGAVARRFAGSDAVLLVGTFDDLNTRGFGFPPEGGEDGGGVAAKCDGPTADSPGICNCTGKKDCADMSKAGLCTGRGSAVCGKGSNGHWGCSCIAKGS
jgi:hypothetical protein